MLIQQEQDQYYRDLAEEARSLEERVKEDEAFYRRTSILQELEAAGHTVDGLLGPKPSDVSGHQVSNMPSLSGALV